MTLAVESFLRCVVTYETDSADDYFISMRQTWQPLSGCALAPGMKPNYPKGFSPRKAIFWSASTVIGVEFRRYYPISTEALANIESQQRSGTNMLMDGISWTLYGWIAERRYERTYVK
jgi:hypothetical protein